MSTDKALWLLLYTIILLLLVMLVGLVFVCPILLVAG